MKKRIIILLIIGIIGFIGIIGLCINIYRNRKWTKGYSVDIPNDYFTHIYANEKSMYKLDYSNRHWSLYLYIEDNKIRGVSVHKIDKIGSQAAIMGSYSYQETIEFKTLDKLTKFINKMEIIGIGDIYSSRINNAQAKKYLVEHATEIKTNELIGTGRYSMDLVEFIGLLKIIYQNT